VTTAIPTTFCIGSSGQQETRSRYFNAKAAELTGKARAVLKQDERGQLYREAQVVLKEDAANVTIAHTTPPLAAKNTVQGLHASCHWRREAGHRLA